MQSTLCSERGTGETHEDQGGADVLVVLLHVFGTYCAPPPLATLLRSCHLPLLRLPLVVTDYIRDTYGFIRSPPCMRCNLEPFCLHYRPQETMVRFSLYHQRQLGLSREMHSQTPAWCYVRAERGGGVMKLSLLATKYHNTGRLRRWSVLANAP